MSLGPCRHHAYVDSDDLFRGRWGSYVIHKHPRWHGHFGLLAILFPAPQFLLELSYFGVRIQ